MSDDAQCTICGKGGLSTEEDGGPECQLSDGTWVCSRACWETAARIAELQAERDRYRATAYKLAAAEGALLDRVNELQAENARLRGLVDHAQSIFENCEVLTGACCCGDSMENHSDPMICGHSAVDMGQHSVNQWLAAWEAKP